MKLSMEDVRDVMLVNVIGTPSVPMCKLIQALPAMDEVTPVEFMEACKKESFRMEEKAQTNLLNDFNILSLKDGLDVEDTTAVEVELEAIGFNDTYKFNLINTEVSTSAYNFKDSNAVTVIEDTLTSDLIEYYYMDVLKDIKDIIIEVKITYNGSSFTLSRGIETIPSSMRLVCIRELIADTIEVEMDYKREQLTALTALKLDVLGITNKYAYTLKQDLLWGETPLMDVIEWLQSHDIKL